MLTIIEKGPPAARVPAAGRASIASSISLPRPLQETRQIELGKKEPCLRPPRAQPAHNHDKTMSER